MLGFGAGISLSVGFVLTIMAGHTGAAQLGIASAGMLLLAAFFAHQQGEQS